MDTIKHFTLINGYELIGTVISHEPTYYVMEKILGVQVASHQDGSYELMFVPFSVVNPNGNHRLYKHAICAASDTIPEDLEKAYIRRTSKFEIIGSL